MNGSASSFHAATRPEIIERFPRLGDAAREGFVVDLHLTWGGDIVSSPTGDLVTVGTPTLGTERVLRRLLTTPGAYIWHPGYGAGLARFVGEPVDVAEIQALIRSQMLLETAVAADPEPVISVQLDPSGSLFVQVRYADADTAEALTLNIQVSR